MARSSCLSCHHLPEHVVVPVVTSMALISSLSFFSSRQEALEGINCVSLQPTISLAHSTMSGIWQVFRGCFAK